jgi:hypothetical protein
MAEASRLDSFVAPSSALSSSQSQVEHSPAGYRLGRLPNGRATALALAGCGRRVVVVSKRRSRHLCDGRHGVRGGRVGPGGPARARHRSRRPWPPPRPAHPWEATFAPPPSADNVTSAKGRSLSPRRRQFSQRTTGISPQRRRPFRGGGIREEASLLSAAAASRLCARSWLKAPVGEPLVHDMLHPLWQCWRR